MVTGIMYWVACLLTVAYIRFVNGWQAWVPSREIFTDIVPFVRLVGFGLMMVGAEWYDPINSWRATSEYCYTDLYGPGGHSKLSPLLPVPLAMFQLQHNQY